MQSVRDRVARAEGWTTCTASNGVIVWERGEIDDGTYTTSTDHPIPDTLDACAEAWHKHAGEHGWGWWRGSGEWLAQSRGPFVRVPSTGTDPASERRDRWALLGLVMDAMVCGSRNATS